MECDVYKRKKISYFYFSFTKILNFKSFMNNPPEVKEGGEKLK